MTIGSLFSGIGGLELGLERSGLGPILWQVESDPYCCKVLSRHWPEVERHDDIRTLSAPAPVDIICGGFPCQDVSAAGKRVGLAGSRSGLWYEFARIVEECRPRWVVVENVASGAKLWVDAVRGGLERLGYATLPVPLSAADVGAPHLRRRIFIIGCSADAKCDELRQQPGWGGRESWGGEGVLGVDGTAELLADANGLDAEHSGPGAGALLGLRPAPSAVSLRHSHLARLEERSAESHPDEQSPAERAGWWPAEPDVDRVAHGVSSRVDRLRALGNAVVPQCAEVIGHIILELIHTNQGDPMIEDQEAPTPEAVKLPYRRGRLDYQALAIDLARLEVGGSLEVSKNLRTAAVHMAQALFEADGRRMLFDGTGDVTLIYRVK